MGVVPFGAVASFLAAGVSSAALTPIVARLAERLGVLSPARPDRWGQRRTPLLGGLAIALGALLPVTVFAGSEDRLTAIALGTLGALVLGTIDDVRGLRPSSKIVGQTIIASGLAIGGVRVELVDVAPLSFLLTLVWVVGMMNAVNLIDNMDGLAAGVCAIAAGVLLFMAPVEPAWVRLLAAATAGACIGFLVHNFPPARVYMGDAGSMVLGFVLASLALILTNTAASNVALAVLGPLLVLGLPIFDTALVTLARRLEGRPVGKGGRDHTSHRLAARGLSERSTVLVLYAIAVGLAVVGLLSSALGLVFLPLAGLVVVALAVFGVFLLMSPEDEEGHTPARLLVMGAGRRLVRFGSEIALDAALATIALFSAFLIRFEALPPATFVHLFLQAAPIVIPIQLGAFVLLDVYRILWSYMGVTDLVVVLRASFVGTLTAGLFMIYVLGFAEQSRAVLLMDGVFLGVLVAGSRLFFVWLRHWSATRPRVGVRRRVLIVGASERGQLALRLLARNRDTAYLPVGFIDDDPGKQRRRIGGVPVVGRAADLAEVVRRHRADLIILATSDEETRAAIRSGCAALGVELRELSQTLIGST